MNHVTRFAPSPTGSLHIGGVRTAIFNWLFARHNKGRFVLRIEDTDRERSTPESLQEILDSMKWLGLDWDGDIVKQSERTELYTEAVRKLLSQDKAYKCYMSPAELAEKREAAKSEGKVFRYKREWATETEAPDKPYAIRLLTPDSGVIHITDSVRGVISFEAKDIDDFIILRTDGSPIYNLAVVVDDSEMGITDVIRGEDHLSNTPKQVLIYEALGLQIPRFAHVSMILGEDKAKLSKRHGAASVDEYRKLGYFPEALINYLVRLGWSYGDQEIFSKDELVEKFTLDNIGKSPAVFNPEKLLWLNSQYLRNKPLGEVAHEAVSILNQRGLDVSTDERVLKIVELARERSRTLIELVDSIFYFFTDEFTYDEKARNKFLKPENVAVLKLLLAKLSEIETFDHDSIKSAVESVTGALDLKLVKVAQPARVALTGGTVSPGIFEVMELLGKDAVIKRLTNAINSATNMATDSTK